MYEENKMYVPVRDEINPEVALDRLLGRVVKLLSFVLRSQEVTGSSMKPKQESMHQLGHFCSFNGLNPDGIYARFS